MRALALLLAAVSVHSVAGHATRRRDSHNDLYKRAIARRNIVLDGSIADSYDYVIVGGGTAGLVLAARLSEDSNTTVLVLEAGDTGEAVQDQIDIPSFAYYNSLIGTSYDWNYETVPQPNASNRELSWPRGKVLGGSSAVNGMYLVRPSEVEVDAWASMVENGSIWSWDNLYDAMKKSETYTPPVTTVDDVAHIEYQNSSHGFSGPLHASYPGYMMPQVGNWTSTFNNVGVMTSTDPDGGDGWGAFVATSAINPSNWTRSYSRNAYIDPLPPRSNLAILPNATVTRLVFTNSTGGNLTATSVEYASYRGAATQSVSVSKEVILAAGAIGSPQILMLSGVGPADVLQAAGVTVQKELPGVGQHLQDHIYAEVTWKTNEQTAATIYYANYSDDTPTVSTPFLSFINSATAYVNLSTLVAEPDTYASEIADAVNTNAASLVPSQYSEVVEGYKAIYNITAQKLLTSSVGQMEILLSLTGAGQYDQQVVSVQAALQHPFSQGRLYINSSDAFDYPIINPQYLSHNADLVLLRQGLKFCRTIGNTSPLSAAMGEEVSPGSSVNTDEEWEEWLAQNIYTEYHPSCSCAMLPESQGGVVDAQLKVYGLNNVRVADSSVFPFEFSAHLQAPTYGLAEQAASLIKGTYVNADAPSSSSSSSSTSTASSSTGSSSSTSKKNGAVSALRQPSWAASLGVATLVVLSALAL
ncbi:GMC oxidoreductase [Wolfiporia cocos MD-104 SS10]|uniref:GMC oxidoreductase n=1 Tax=Wolfiporia cocos (strain MD-104) TaxID=742152 RepID=A0A2H3JIH5_WOLCO|nr:GMC oxidoreductase [Wolfiporia cocos MD-104 SS10]